MPVIFSVRRRAGRNAEAPLPTCSPPMPRGSRPGPCCSVVDPGVGGDRRALIAAAEGRHYVGPDNGLFEIVLRRAAAGRATCWEITWRPELLSASFHGRDLFAPVAARRARRDPGTVAHQRTPMRGRGLARRSRRDRLYRPLRQCDDRAARRNRRRDRKPASGSRTIAPAPTFSAVPPGAAFWYVNSNGLVEIAVNGGRAAG